MRKGIRQNGVGGLTFWNTHARIVPEMFVNEPERHTDGYESQSRADDPPNLLPRC